MIKALAGQDIIHFQEKRVVYIKKPSNATSEGFEANNENFTSPKPFF